MQRITLTRGCCGERGMKRKAPGENYPKQDIARNQSTPPRLSLDIIAKFGVDPAAPCREEQALGGGHGAAGRECCSGCER
mmetsp:Transcript_52008/g.108632  ORF Transcript_52008/g.108632 Transcript_52008/m.108632 type:complete len:80 (-) Transcript_52008:429-668(-)